MKKKKRPRRRDKGAEDAEVQKTRQAPAKAQRKRRVPDTESMVISEQGKSFADILCSVKTAIKGQPEVVIYAVRKSGDGRVVLQVKKGVGAIEATQKLFSEKMAAAKVTTRKPREDVKILHIRGIDETETQGEIKEDIAAALGKTAAELTMSVGALRPTGDKVIMAVTVKLKPEDAQLLVEKKRVRIGIVSCRVQERLEIVRCYKCWCTGHESRKCKGPDRSKACHNCGKDCQRQPPCLLCGMDGHRAWSAQCDKFKEELARLRRRDGS